MFLLPEQAIWRRPRPAVAGAASGEDKPPGGPFCLAGLAGLDRGKETDMHDRRRIYAGSAYRYTGGNMATSYNIDAKLDETLEQLKLHLGASSKAEVLRKAVALLNVATRHENADGSVTILQQNSSDKPNETKVILR
ncbi:hypothetical protein [Massilia sp. Dwa41.01b]|uniref:hypothetical protein n=2 Tax=unclassified Massilia TaxID=2609279 RepID=UPI001AEDC03A|nr:hypothetical protein [Massilia sp. Dwa41.01b]